MLDFPDAPVDGDTHIEEGQVWTYREPPGVWAVSDTTGDLTTIVTADVRNGNGSWQIWGDTLIQWGRVGTASDGYGTITYPKEFKELPAVVVTPYWGTANVNTRFKTTGETTTGTEVYAEGNTSGTPLQMGNNLRWIAIGPALDADKMPKEVPVSSTGGYFAEYHDPLGYASWRITGTTLECWGRTPAGAYEHTITFPKTFANNLYGLTATIGNSGDDGRIVNIFNLTVAGFSARTHRPDGGEAGNVFRWHAIGQWDGVS